MTERLATYDDAMRIFDRLRNRVGPLGYQVAICGSVLFLEECQDIDFVIAAVEDAQEDGSKVGMKIAKLAHRLIYYEENDDGSFVSIVYRTREGLVIDCAIVGLPREGE